MTDVMQWQEEVKRAVQKYARNAQPDRKQDLTQECYLKILENQEAVDAARNPKWFVLRLCRNLLFNTGRESANARKEVSLSDPAVFAEANRPETISGFGVSTADLEEAIQSLPVDQQYVLRCSFFLGRTEKEIIRDLGKSQATVRRIRQAAFTRLRELLEAKNAG